MQTSKIKIGERDVQLMLMRAEVGEHWPRLTKASPSASAVRFHGCFARAAYAARPARPGACDETLA